MYSIKFHFKAGQRAPGLRSVKAVLGKGPPRSLSLRGPVGGARKHNLSKPRIVVYSPVRAGRLQGLELEQQWSKLPPREARGTDPAVLTGLPLQRQSTLGHPCHRSLLLSTPTAIWSPHKSQSAVF